VSFLLWNVMHLYVREKSTLHSDTVILTHREDDDVNVNENTPHKHRSQLPQQHDFKHRCSSLQYSHNSKTPSMSHRFLTGTLYYLL